MKDKTPLDYPCPCCGFLTFDQPPGGYTLCEVCDWEDDGVQLRFAASGGGANRESLCEYQQKWLAIIPLQVTEYQGFLRVQNWRPVTLEECSGAQNFEVGAGLPESPPYYWER